MIRVKICGLTSPEHAAVAAEAGASFVGLMFAESKRKLTIERARPIAEAVRQQGAARPRIVGVFANQTLGEMHRIADGVGLDLMQLSGDEPADMVTKVRWPVIKACHLSPGKMPDSELAAVRKALHYIRDAGALPLLDTKAPGRYGGTGRTFDWDAAQRLAEEFDFLLAGGLTPDNVGEAVRRVMPWGVDVSSGVERDGEKDPVLIREFIRAVRAAEPPPLD
jgi:phosphoribosylanthranilate isomerase